MRNWLDLGNWNAICDSCGRKYKATSLRKRWDGLMVCEEDWEVRHPQDFIKVQKEKISVPFNRPDLIEDNYLYFCDLWSSSQMADYGTADCSFVGGNTSIQLLINTYNPRAIAGYAIAGRTISGVLGT